MDTTARQKQLIEKYLDHATDHNWWENTYEDFIEVAAAFGIPTCKDQIRFSGFCSQGDGACFETSNFTLAEILDAGIKTLQEKTYGDDESKFTGYVEDFHLLYATVYEKIGAIALLHPDGRQVAESYGRRVFYNGPYCHEFTMRLDDSTFAAFTFLDEEAAARCSIVLDEDFENEIRNRLRCCAKSLYRTLEAEYDHLTSDEAVWEMIVANGWDEEEEGDDEQDEAA